MSKDKLQEINILLSREGDTRRLLYGWRDINNFYSTLPKSKQHQSYHDNGRFHTKKAWGERGEDFYDNIKFIAEPHSIKNATIIQGIILRNEANHHTSESKFKAHKKPIKNNDFIISSIDLKENTFLAFAIGAAKNKGQINQYLNNIKKYGNLYLLSIKILPEINDSIIFAIAFTQTQEKDENDFAKGCAQALKVEHGLILPHAGNYSLTQGGFSTFDFKMPNTSKPTVPIHENPPALPINLEPWMQRYEGAIDVSRITHQWIELGPLSICALFKSYSGFQYICVMPTELLSKRHVTIINNSNSTIIEAARDALLLIFHYGYAGGHRSKQFRCGGKDYQMNITRVSGRRPSILHPMNYNYGIELFELN